MSTKGKIGCLLPRYKFYFNNFKTTNNTLTRQVSI